MLLGATRMLKQSETKDFQLEKLQLVKEQSTQLKEGIVSNLIQIYDVIIKLFITICIIIITQIYLMDW